MAVIEPSKSMRTFIVIWAGQLISLLGSGLTSFALGVWIFEQTGKAIPFAIVVLFSSLPAVLLGPWVGAVADRFNRKKIILLGDTGSALVTLAVLLLLQSGNLQIWNIYLIALIGSVFSAFQEPAFSASVVMLVSKKDLQRANGLSQMSNALGNLVSPILAGALFLLIGLKGIILIDFITYFAALFTLIISDLPQPPCLESAKKESSWQNAMAGWRYLRIHSGLLGLVIFFAVINFMLNFAMVLTGPLILSTFSSQILGVVNSIAGLGALAGSIVLSIWGGPKNNKIKVIILFAFINSLGLGLAGLRANAVLMSLGFFILMFFVPLVSGTSQAIFQVKVPADLQGRVFAMRSMISRSIMPLAFLTAGPLADYVFEPLLRAGGGLADTLVAQITGVGAGRGIGLLFLICMLGELLAIAWVWSNRKVRNIETEVPDIVSE